MNTQIFRPGSIALGAVVIGGVLLLVVPEHGLTIVRLVIVTVAAAAGLHALGVNAPPTWWLSPFDRKSGAEGDALGTREIDWIRSRLSGWRQPVAGGSPLPPDVLRQLRPLVEVAVERARLGRGGAAAHASVRRLSPLTRAILASDPKKRPRWFRMVPPDRREVASVVHRVLDELDRLAGDVAGDRVFDNSEPRET